MSQPHAELHLYRHAETAWRSCVLPWLDAGRARLSRSWVVVPTRAQATAWKLRCLDAGIPLIGVEFLTPGLARQKWLNAGLAGKENRPVLGREFLLHGLRIALEEEIALSAPGTDDRGILETLRSDAETAFDDYDELLRTGLGPQAFEWPAVQRVFTRLEAWSHSLGYESTTDQVRRALQAPRRDTPLIEGRLLICGLSAENWGEWGNVAALVRCFNDVSVLLPEPELRGRNHLDEAWVNLWERVLDTPGLPLDAPPPADHAGLAADEWLHGDVIASAGRHLEVFVGRTRNDEVRLAAQTVASWLNSGARHIAVVLPAAGPTAFRLARVLSEFSIRFQDTTGLAGAPSAEAQAQRALLAFFASGRWQEWFGVCARFERLGLTKVREIAVRDKAARLFDDLQAPNVAAYRDLLAGADDDTSRALVAFMERVPLSWPERLSLAELVTRVKDVFVSLQTGIPPGWEALEAFALKDTRELPAASLWPLLEAFVPADAPASQLGTAPGFVRVTLTTRKRAEAVSWTHVLLLESNAGVWPSRPDASCWLPDERRQLLSRVDNVPTGLMTSDDRARLEKLGYASLARNASSAVVLTAALQSEEDPEASLAPNSWVERVLWREGCADGAGVPSEKLESLFEKRARAFDRTPESRPFVESWREIWKTRRNPAAPFDEFFLCADPETARVPSIAARVAEAGFQDPAVLWFSALLKIGQVNRQPLERARKKWLGQRAHAILAESLRTPAVEGRFGPRPDFSDVRAKARLQIEALATVFGGNLYWKSCYNELETLVFRLLEKVEVLPAKPFLAVELSLPKGTQILIGHPDRRIELRGRVDLVFSDRPHWEGADVEIVDFKTGADGNLTVERMQAGHSLQLGLYLAAAQGLGIREGRVTMVKPDEKPTTSLALRDLGEALTGLERLDLHFRTGRYGALTQTATDYARSNFDWPLACVPVPLDILEKKFALTFAAQEVPHE